MGEVQFENISLEKDDPLKVVKFLVADIFQFKFSRAVLWAVLFVHVVVSSTTTYFILFRLNRKECVEIATVYFQSFYIILAILTLLFRQNLVNVFMERLKPWTMNNVDKKTRLSIERKILRLKVYIILLFFLGVVSSSFMIPILPNDRNLFFAVRFFDEYFSNYSIFLIYLYKMTLPFAMYVSLVHTGIILYITQHSNFQIVIFKNYLANVANLDNLDDLSYQEQVRKRLLFCIKRSTYFVELWSSTVNEIKSMIVGFSICGCIVGISAVGCLACRCVTPEKMMMFSMVATAAFCGTIWAGQSIESELEEVSKTLMKINWYYFDKYNKKLYLIFLTNTMKARKIKFSENYSINYELGLAIVKGIYSVASVLFSMMHSEK